MAESKPNPTLPTLLDELWRSCRDGAGHEDAAVSIKEAVAGIKRTKRGTIVEMKDGRAWRVAVDSL